MPNREKLDVLKPGQAREGAEYLAAAAVLCRRLKFRISDLDEVSGESLLSPADVLPESWLPKDRLALMDRALFDAASHGAMSFHHRYHTEYLAAAWIARLMAHNCGTDALEDLLFATLDGQWVMRPSLKPVAAWLVTEGEEPWRQRLAEWIFARQYRSEPRSDYQLFRLIVQLLVDIKNHVERSENAANRLWVRKGDQEEKFRGGLFDKMSERSLDWFKVVQEKEVDQRQRPDLCVERPGLNSLPIEVKLADSWTISVLLERLENQLVGQYLRPANIRHGIYVLGNAGTKKSWEMPGTGERINFQALMSLIQERAAAIQIERRANVDGIEVIGIDFSDPRER